MDLQKRVDELEQRLNRLHAAHVKLVHRFVTVETDLRLIDDFEKVGKYNELLGIPPQAELDSTP